jgi:hypothetical protein
MTNQSCESSTIIFVKTALAVHDRGAIIALVLEWVKLSLRAVIWRTKQFQQKKIERLGKVVLDRADASLTVNHHESTIEIKLAM